MRENIDIPLDRFQQWMQQMLLDPFQKTKVNPYDLLSHTGIESLPGDVLNHSKRLTAHEHLAIYQRSYIARLRSCMTQQFSCLEYALSEEIFIAFADQYLALNPSLHYNLSALGARFANHIETNRPDAFEDIKEDWIDFIVELARFEYDINVIFEQKATENYQLADYSTPEEKMELIPLCNLYKFQFPVNTFYTAFKKGEKPDLPFVRETYCAVLRHNYQLYIYDIHAEQYKFLNYLKTGMDIPAVKSAFLQQSNISADAFEQTWTIWKQRWIDANFFRV